MQDREFVLILDAIGDVRNDVNSVRLEASRDREAVSKRLETLSRRLHVLSAKLDERTTVSGADDIEPDSYTPDPVNRRPRGSITRAIRKHAPSVGASAGVGALVVTLFEVIGPLIAKAFGGS